MSLEVLSLPPSCVPTIFCFTCLDQSINSTTFPLPLLSLSPFLITLWVLWGHLQYFYLCIMNEDNRRSKTVCWFKHLLSIYLYLPCLNVESALVQKGQVLLQQQITGKSQWFKATNIIPHLHCIFPMIKAMRDPSYTKKMDICLIAFINGV